MEQNEKKKRMPWLKIPHILIAIVALLMVGAAMVFGIPGQNTQTPIHEMNLRARLEVQENLNLASLRAKGPELLEQLAQTAQNFVRSANESPEIINGIPMVTCGGEIEGFNRIPVYDKSGRVNVKNVVHYKVVPRIRPVETVKGIHMGTQTVTYRSFWGKARDLSPL